MSNFCQKFVQIVRTTPLSRFYATSGYKSAISLEKLYPGSSLKLTTPSKPPNEGNDKFTGYIPIDELNITYSKSTGPGGQNVNKVNTKVEIRFHVNSASWISDDVKAKLTEKLKNRLTKEGFAVFRSDLTRSQQLNLADCLEKIRTSVRSCIVEEKPTSEETQERLRRRHERAVRERLSIKRERSRVKNDRQTPQVIL